MEDDDEPFERKIQRLRLQRCRISLDDQAS